MKIYERVSFVLVYYVFDDAFLHFGDLKMPCSTDLSETPNLSFTVLGFRKV